MEESQLITLIDKYLAGKASRKEVEKLDAWLAGFHTRSSPLSSLSLKELKNISDKMYSAITGVLDDTFL